ncbi:MAG: TonB family protein [Flavobacteriales bacterium]|nr:TonB family protein [Flavobacteriales bacterium]
MKRIIPLLFIAFIVSFASYAQEEDVFVIVDHMPVFEGGEEVMNKFFLDEMKYPRLAASGGIKGKVHVSFIVDEEGNISDVKVLKGRPGGLSKEAVRLVNKMPRWIPGKQGDIMVKVQMTVQVDFPLELKAYKHENKKIRCNPMPNINQYGVGVYYESQYFVWVYNKGIDALKHKKYKKAEELFNRALEICGPTGVGSSHVYFNRAIARLYQNNNSLACGDFRRARKIGYAEIDKTIKEVCRD